jgi:hypothetical protein
VSGYQVTFVARDKDVAIVIEKNGSHFQSIFWDTSEPEALRARLAAAGPAGWLKVAEEVEKARGRAA